MNERAGVKAHVWKKNLICIISEGACLEKNLICIIIVGRGIMQ